MTLSNQRLREESCDWWQLAVAGTLGTVKTTPMSGMLGHEATDWDLLVGLEGFAMSPALPRSMQSE